MSESPSSPTRTPTRVQDGGPGNIGAASDSESPPGLPRWVKVSGIIAIVLLLAVVGLHLTGHGGGPAMHDMPMHGVMLP